MRRRDWHSKRAEPGDAHAQPQRAATRPARVCACLLADLLYVLKFILGDFCIVCTGFHVVNFSMLAVAVLEYRAVEGKGRRGD